MLEAHLVTVIDNDDIDLTKSSIVVVDRQKPYIFHKDENGRYVKFDDPITIRGNYNKYQAILTTEEYAVFYEYIFKKAKKPDSGKVNEEFDTVLQSVVSRALNGNMITVNNDSIGDFVSLNTFKGIFGFIDPILHKLSTKHIFNKGKYKPIKVKKNKVKVERVKSTKIKVVRR